MRALVAEHPVGAVGEPVEQPLRTQEVDVGERGEEEQALDAAGETDQVEQELLALRRGLDPIEALDRVDPLEAELGLGPDRGDVLDRRERRLALGHVGQVVVEQREVELHVQRLLVELPRQVHPGFGGVDVLVQVEHQVVRHDRVARGEERHQPRHEVLLRRHQLAVEVDEVVGEVDLVDGPGVLDGVLVHVEEHRVAHRPQREVESGVEDVRRPSGAAPIVRNADRPDVRATPLDVLGGSVSPNWALRAPCQSHASQASGLARLQAIASSSVKVFLPAADVSIGASSPPPVGGVGVGVPVPLVVAWLMRVAGRLRR